MEYSYKLPNQSKQEIDEAFKSAQDETKQRLTALNKGIDSAMSKIKSYQSKLSRQDILLPIVKIHGGLVQEREELLEEFRVQRSVEEAKARGWNRSYTADVLGECPVCLDDLLDDCRIGRWQLIFVLPSTFYQGSQVVHPA